MIVEIGLWVIEQAFRQIAWWSGGRRVRAVHDAHQPVGSPDRAGRCGDPHDRARAKVGVDPTRVCFELTETAS